MKKINTGLRPAKVATFIFKGFGWREKVLEVIKTNSQIWGGWHNIIIPTDGKSIDESFWVLLEVFDPDYLTIYNETGKNKNLSNKLIEEIRKRLNPFGNDDSTEFLPITNHHFHPDFHYNNLTHLADIFDTTNLESTAIYNPNIVYSKSKIIRDNLNLMSFSVLGMLTPKFQQELENLEKNRFGVSERNFDNLNEILGLIWEKKRVQSRSFEHEAYPFHFSMVNLEKYYFKPEYLRQLKNSAVLVVGDDIEDFCLYYTLSRLRLNVIWAPFSLIKESLREYKSCRSTLFNNVPFNHDLIFELLSYQDEGAKILLTSFSKTTNELEEVKTILKSSVGTDLLSNSVERYDTSVDIDKLLPYSFDIFEFDNQSNWYLEQFENNKSLHPIDTPIPRNFSHRSFAKHYWITEIKIEDYQLPMNKALNQTLNANFYSSEDIRISKRGISYFCPNNTRLFNQSIDHYLVRPELTLLEPFEIFEQLFGELDYQINVSDKGRYTLQTIEKFGSLEKIAKIFANKSYRSLFDQFIKIKKNGEKEDHDEGCYLKDRRRYLDMISINKILKDVPDFISTIDDFIERGILHRGFIFKCEICNHSAWYGINEISNKFSCKACGKSLFYKAENFIPREDLLEPPWFYKLDEVIYKGYVNNMIVPILTLYKLMSNSKESFLYIPELEVISGDSKQELDICCIVDGEIIIGECKKPNELTNKEIKKYKNFYYQLPSKYIVLSTFNIDGWSNLTLTKINKILGEQVEHVIYKQGDLIS